ncbi:MAG: hypothetical protein R8N23_09765 [Reichenbachiella sp.]|uniref:hypothetical protein n=1 Tax=Reichenbachiella sp. TaxID=2184521 RepID=UPI002966A061|nr:hypothetical protein [Reichenbachiella sp.]MDW3210145.1 hypothetical protein [Reichenbachiella sp.]
MKTNSNKSLGLTTLILLLSFQTAFSQFGSEVDPEYHDFLEVGAQKVKIFKQINGTEGEYMLNTGSLLGVPQPNGIGFYVNDKQGLVLQDNDFKVLFDMTVESNLTVNGYINNFSMVSNGEITNLNTLQGTNDLNFKGAPGDGSDMIITESGSIVMGASNDYPSKLVVVGPDNNGTEAILNLRNDGHSMLLDGNEIDATAGTLFLQNNSAHNIEALNQGGNLGLNITAPQERLHLYGNLRIDDGAIMSHGPLEFKPDVDASDDDEIVFYNNIEEETMRIHTDGNVGIGVAAPTQKLEVDGTIKATSFVTSTASFPDYVFSSSYKKLSLNNLDQYIQVNKHLPNMPAEAEVVANGLDVADVVIKSVENIETIYLHLIEMNQKLDQLQQENAALKAQLNK